MATKKNSSAKSPQATSRSNRDSMRWILGLLLLFAGLFLTASVLFYYFDWRADMSLVSGVEQEDPRLADLSDAIENPCGYAGAWLAERLVGRSFGLFGIILPLIVTMVGVRIIRQRPLLFNHSVLGALLILILGSLTLGFAFGEMMDVHALWIDKLPLTPVLRVVYFLISFAALTLGIALSNHCKLPIIPTDLFPRELAVILNKPYKTVKTRFDLGCLTVTVVLSLLFLHGIRGIGIGTVFCALVMGRCIFWVGERLTRHFVFVSFLAPHPEQDP